MDSENRKRNKGENGDRDEHRATGSESPEEFTKMDSEDGKKNKGENGDQRERRGMGFESPEEFLNYVRRYIRQKGFWEWGLVDDLANEVYLRIRRAGYDWDTVPNRSYVRLTCESVTADWFRRHKFRPRGEEATGQEPTPEPADGDGGEGGLGQEEVDEPPPEGALDEGAEEYQPESGQEKTPPQKPQSGTGGWREIPLEEYEADLKKGWSEATSTRLRLDDAKRILAILVDVLAEDSRLKGRSVDHGAFLLLHLRFALCLKVRAAMTNDVQEMMEATEALMAWPPAAAQRRVRPGHPTIAETWSHLAQIEAEHLDHGLAGVWEACTAGLVNRNWVYQNQKRALRKLKSILLEDPPEKGPDSTEDPPEKGPASGADAEDRKAAWDIVIRLLGL